MMIAMMIDVLAAYLDSELDDDYYATTTFKSAPCFIRAKSMQQ